MTLLIVAIVLGFYVAWNIGANDVANAMGTSVGSGALTLAKAVIIAAILECAGTFLLGSHVSETVESGIVDPSSFTPMIYVLGMLASLLAAGVWLQIASYFGWPVSTTHSIVGAIIGFGLVTVGMEAIQWVEVGLIMTSWVISPLLGGTIAFLLFHMIRRRIFYSRQPIIAAKRTAPYLVFLVFSTIALVLLFDGIPHTEQIFSFWEALGLSILIGLVTGVIAYFLVKRIPTPSQAPSDVQEIQVSVGLEKALKHLRRVKASATLDLQKNVATLVSETLALTREVKKRNAYEGLDIEHRNVERIFVYLQVISASFMAFAHGANDVANAIGPLAGVVNTLRTGVITYGLPIPLWILGLGGAGIVIGLATWGWRVIRTVGKRITELTPTRGFSAEFGAALTILVASRLGLPISTTHTLVGAVLGVGLARGISAINLRVVRDILISWVVTIPAGALLAILFFHIFQWIFL